MDSGIREIEILETEFKELCKEGTREALLEEGKCISKNIYTDNHTLSIQYHPQTAYLITFLVLGDVKDRLTLREFLHKKIVFDKRFGYDVKNNLWIEFSPSLERLDVSFNSKELAKYFYGYMQ